VKSDVNDVAIRYPCTGAVLAVNAGDPDPRPAFAEGVPTTAVYVESYLITDPNDHTWNVDKWSYTDLLGASFLIWTVPILGSDAGYNTPDDGVQNCNPFGDSVLYNANDPRAADPTIPRTGTTCGNGVPIPWKRDLPVQPNTCNTYTTGRTDTHPRILYNALLYFFLDDLTIAGADKNHRDQPAPGSADYQRDGSGCQAGTEWACPNDPITGLENDNSEGNSHPYNPFEGLPVCPHCTGSGNHGGSGAAIGVDPSTQFLHATRNIDLYFWIGELPAVRNLRVVDTEGSLAPFHCHDGQALDAYHPDSDLICDDGYLP
jgi:hypothetical protein